ncbi:MAG: type II secretion system GspH family protein [Leptolyngbya sp. Prado105]|jgi:type II secretory pathway pseudopilin PulG|nr:type II secretion system GspH family protein [Leptolyngbya sp. Prado105]
MVNDHQFTRQQLPSLAQSRRILNLIQKTSQPFESDQGLTLIEGLIAIVIIAITLVSITPPIFWAVASRVQTQRAEQSLQIAQGEIDRVRALVERNEVGSTQFSLLPPVQAGATESDLRNKTSSAFPVAPTTAKAASAVRSIRDCSAAGGNDDGNSGSASSFFRVDSSGDCRTDYLVQTFRSQGLDQNGNVFQGTSGQELAAFVMGVRVYAAVAEPSLTSSRGKTDAVSLKGTSGLGNQLDRPLAVMYSTIVRSTDSSNLDLYRKLCPNRNTGAC